MKSLELQDAIDERCAYLFVIASIITVGQMVATIVRRVPRLQIIRNKKLELAGITKTGIHTNPVVNAAIDDIVLRAQGSGSGTATSSTAIPLLLKKRRQLEESGESGKD